MSQDSQALILWEPKYLFFPPVQEPPPPTRVFRHIDLVEEEEEVAVVGRRPFFEPTTPQRAHTPDHEFIFPPLFLNNTFLRFIHDLPKHLPLPLIDLSPSPQGDYCTHRSYWNTQTHMDESAFIEEIQADEEEEEEKESSLESIDETEDTPMDFDPSPLMNKTKKPTQITLKRKEPDYEDDVFSSDYQIDNSTTTNSNTSAKRVKSNEEGSLEQWRVGKRPGYQGSFIAPKKNTHDNGEEEVDEGSNGRKRTFNQSITSSAERVLKKPFKPPTQVPPKARLPILTKSTNPSPSSPPNTNNSSPSNRTPTTHSTPTTNRSTLVDPYFPDFPTPPPSGSKSVSRSNRSTTKPFKTPMRTNRSTAPSPSTRDNRRQGENLLKTSPRANSDEKNENQTDQQKIKNLQEEIRITQQAIKYKNEDDNEKLRELVLMWRTAGRDIVEKLFTIVPKPVDFGVSSSSSSSDTTTPSSSTYQGYNFNQYNSSWNTPSSNFDINLNTPELTVEQSEWLRTAKRNKDGEIVDDDDNPLIIGESEHEIKSFWEDIGKRGGSLNYGQSTSNRSWSTHVNHHGSYTNSHNDFSSSPPLNESETGPELASKSEEWDYSSLMRLFNVDPDLLGWNSLQEDWNENE